VAASVDTTGSVNN